MANLTTSQRKDVLTDLYSGDEKRVDAALSTIKQKGDASMVSDLLQIVVGSENEHTVNAVWQLLFTLKDEEAVNALIDFLKDEQFEGIRVMILTACWECGLDTSHRLSDLLNVALEGHYLEVLEVLTIVENWEKIPNQAMLKEETVRFRDALSEKDITETEDLYQSLLSVLDAFIRK